MDFLNGLKNFLNIVNENWTIILIIIGLILGIVQKIKNYMQLSTDEKIEIAKKQISERILKLISDAEENYQEWESAGAIKRSEVISKIYAEYPILSNVIEQDELITWIDEQIDNALPTLRELWDQKTEKEEKEAEKNQPKQVVALKIVPSEKEIIEDVTNEITENNN